MTEKQKAPSANWAISASGAIGASKGALGGGFEALTLFDVDSQVYIPMTLKGGSLGAGLPFGVTVSTFSPTFFRTSKPIWASGFEGTAIIMGVEMSIGAGGSISYITFNGVDHSPYWLDIGGAEAGIAAGIGAGLWRCSVYGDSATPNNGCLITPGGDPLCGGASKKVNSSRDTGMSSSR